EFSAAKPHYEAVQEIFQTLVAKEPNKPRWKSELGDAYNNLGKLALEQGQLDNAIAAYSADQRIKAELVARDPANHQQQEFLAISNAILGRTLAICGETEGALQDLRNALAILKSLLKFDAKQVTWLFLQVRYSEQFGGMLRQIKQFEE